MRLIDADALCKKLQAELGSPEGHKKLMRINYLITHAPTIEAEPVVRCKDCKYRDAEDGFCDKLSIRDEIAGLPGIWKPASVKPEREGEYLVLWNLREGEELNYKAMYYSERIAWEGFRNRVRYWTELPEMPEVEE